MNHDNAVLDQVAREMNKRTNDQNFCGTGADPIPAESVEAGAVAADAAGIERPPNWPPRLAVEAFYGLAGDIIGTVESDTEADPAAVLVQLLVAVGNVVGRSPHFKAEADRHGLNLFTVIVGDTAKARKGSSWGIVTRQFSLCDEQVRAHGEPGSTWEQRVVTGLSSGEGLIAQVADPPGGGWQSPGLKERLVIEPEFAAVLRVAKRDTNTLSPVVRNAWDGSPLQTLTRNSPLQAANAHISIIGHITEVEARRELDLIQIGNGFANRFLWVCARRSKLLPEGGLMSEETLKQLAAKLAEVVTFAREVGCLQRDAAARQLWIQEYPKLSRGELGLVGAVLARAEAQVMRIACIYALLDQSNDIRIEHLMAALAVWRYCEASARYIFGNATGNPYADTILKALLERRTVGLTRTDIRDLFARNANSRQIDHALSLLEEEGKAQASVERCGGGRGRSTERWFPIVQ